jgi:hypothetical protein
LIRRFARCTGERDLLAHGREICVSSAGLTLADIAETEDMLAAIVKQTAQRVRVRINAPIEFGLDSLAA